jgi:hypothetical protein
VLLARNLFQGGAGAEPIDLMGGDNDPTARLKSSLVIPSPPARTKI